MKPSTDLAKVRDIMRRDVTSVTERDELALALQIMLWREIRHLPVVRDHRIVGVLSELVPPEQRRIANRRIAPPLVSKPIHVQITHRPKCDGEDRGKNQHRPHHGLVPLGVPGTPQGNASARHPDLLARG